MPQLDFHVFTFVNALLVFIATGVADLLWAMYIRRTSNGQAFQAGLFSALMVFLGAFVVTSYIENSLYLIPSVFGAFVGTYYTVKIDYEKSKARAESKE